MAKRIKKGHGRRDFIAIKDTVEDLLNKGHCYRDIYDMLFGNKEGKMSYLQFWKYASGKTQLFRTRRNTQQTNEQQHVQNHDHKITTENTQQQKPQQQPQLQNPSAAKRKIIGQEEKQEIKVVTLDDMVG